MKSWNATDLMATVGKIKAEYDATPLRHEAEGNPHRLIGLGAGVYDRCKELGLPVRAINVGEAAASRDNCARLRDELWFKGREWFQDKACSMPQDDGLIAELTAPTYAFTSTGKMVVESKADMKKRGCAHLTWPTPSSSPSPVVRDAKSDTASQSRAITQRGRSDRKPHCRLKLHWLSPLTLHDVWPCHSKLWSSAPRYC